MRAHCVLRPVGCFLTFVRPLLFTQIQICLGPVCIPLHLLLPFLLGLAHQYGLLTWMKREWVTWRFWRNKLFGRCVEPSTLPPNAVKADAWSEGASTSACVCCWYLVTGHPKQRHPKQPLAQLRQRLLITFHSRVVQAHSRVVQAQKQLAPMAA